jgi:hypothetical protein
MGGKMNDYKENYGFLTMCKKCRKKKRCDYGLIDECKTADDYISYKKQTNTDNMLELQKKKLSLFFKDEINYYCDDICDTIEDNCESCNYKNELKNKINDIINNLKGGL